jgi:hypothetical protein
MTQLTSSEVEKVRKVMEELTSVYWREVYAYVIPQFERGQPLKNQIRKARDKLNEVLA